MMSEQIRRTIILLSVAAAALGPGRADARILELTFDDGPDGSGAHDGHAELSNLETLSSGVYGDPLTAALTGEARRSALDQGRYGRAADFPGGAGSIEITGWGDASIGTVTIYMWVMARSAAGGTLVERPGMFAVSLSGGALMFEPGDGSPAVALGQTLPEDGAFHHVALSLDVSSGSPEASAAVDFDLADPVPVTLATVAPDTPLLVGSGLDGMIDELLISPGLPAEHDLFDFNPAYCPAGLLCLEEVITTTPDGMTWEVPVRFKSVYDPALCTAGSPCPLLFDISGGSKCADDYSSPYDAAFMAQAGFMVVTVDAYCEGSDTFRLFPAETSQYVTTKNHIMASGALGDLFSHETYVASGCSHGAGAVAAWTLFEEDYPNRTYARSPGMDGHCALHAGVLCPDVAERHEERFIEIFGSHDDELPDIQAWHASITSVEILTSEITASREMAVSWGINLEGPVCLDDGSVACNEEGLWGMNYGARRFRDGWLMLEPAASPTGYFVEDHGEDCRHCASPGSRAFECGLCLLQHGRAQMEALCPVCLTYDDPDIEFGAPADPCPITASWYEDPLFPDDYAEEEADGEADADDMEPVDAVSDADDDGAGDGGGSEGCSCRMAAGSDPGVSWTAILALALALGFARRRPGRRATASDG
jgi:MYXO-CTERM domain-containing protein